MANTNDPGGDAAEAAIGRHERGLYNVLLVFMCLGIAAGVLMVIAGLDGNGLMLLSGLVAILIGIVSALGRVLIDIGRDLKRVYYIG